MKNYIRKMLGCIAAAVALHSAHAVSISNVTTNTMLFFDNFETGDFNSPLVGSWSFGPDVTVTNAASPGPAEGSFYAQLFRQFQFENNEGNLKANIASQSTAGDVILLRMMVYFPSDTDTSARAQFILDDGDFNTGRAWVQSNGAGHVLAIGPGFAATDTGLTYATNTWQEWDLRYAIGSSTFSVSVGGATASGLASATTGAVGFAEMFNGAFSPAGSFFLDAVPPAETSAAPEPSSIGLVSCGVFLVGWRARHRRGTRHHTTG